MRGRKVGRRRREVEGEEGREDKEKERKGEGREGVFVCAKQDADY